MLHPASPAPRAVIFDLDGVLIDSERVALQVVCRVLGRAGIERTVDDVRHLCGRHRSALAEYLQACVGDAARGARLAEEVVEEIGRHVDAGEMPPFPDAASTVAGLRASGLRIAIASSSERTRVAGELAGTSIAESVDVIVSGEEVKRSKPHPDIFLSAARALGLPPEACVVVEDSVAGVTAARRAGMRVIAVTHTFGASALQDADLVVADLATVGAVVAQQVGVVHRAEANP